MFKAGRRKWRERSKDSSQVDEISEMGERSEVSLRSSVVKNSGGQQMFETSPPDAADAVQAAQAELSLPTQRRSRTPRKERQAGAKSRAPSMVSTATGLSGYLPSVMQPSTGQPPGIAGIPSHTVLLTGVDAEPRAVEVNASCSMDGNFYTANCRRPGLCNIQLKAKRATVEDLETHPARIALADAMKHVIWVADNYDALEREFPNHPWNAVMTVETGLDIPQELLERMVASLYTRSILIDPGCVEALLHIADILQVPAVMASAAEYLKADLIPKHPAACHELGTHVFPQLQLEEAVLDFFKRLQWDGAISQAMLQSIGTVLERCSDETALQFVKGLTEAPSLISPLQAASMSAQLPALKREKLLEGLSVGNLSMADVQSLLHWANNRRANRAVLADSPILWNLLFNNVSSTLLPLDHLKQLVGPKSAHMKLWDLPLAHIPANPGRYKTRRSGWMHLRGGRSFCMEAVYTKDEPGAEWGLFCNPDRQHAFMPQYIIKLCAIQQDSKTPHIELSPDIKPNNEKKLGLGMGFDELLSKWASNKQLVWEKQGESYLTLGLYVDLNEAETPADGLPLSDDPAFVLPERVSTAEIFAGIPVHSTNGTSPSAVSEKRETMSGIPGPPESRGMLGPISKSTNSTVTEISGDDAFTNWRPGTSKQLQDVAAAELSIQKTMRSLTPTRRNTFGAVKTPFAMNGQRLQ